MTLGDATQGKRKATAKEGEVATQRRRQQKERIGQSQRTVERDERRIKGR